MAAAFSRRSPAAIALALGTIYLIWGSTYFGVRITDRTMPPLLMSSVRFAIAGAVLYAVTARGGRASLREWRAAAITGGLLLAVGNAGVAYAEKRIDSGLAALIVAVMPLYVAVLDRALFGRSLSSLATAGLLVGFGGVALLVRPGGSQTGAAVILLGTTAAWAIGSLYARGAPLPASPLRSASMQMLCAAVLLGVAGTVSGESADVHPNAFSLEPLLAFAFLVVFGSLAAFSAYAWLLKNVRISIVSTYAFVNPVVAVVLGSAFLGEPLTRTTLTAGAAIVVAVVLIVSAKPKPAVARARLGARPATLAP